MIASNVGKCMTNVDDSDCTATDYGKTIASGGTGIAAYVKQLSECLDV